MAWQFKDDRPIYLQIIEQIEIRIVSGFYKAGDKLPSVRDMASEAAVNPNTMQKALAELEGKGLLYSQRTSGRFITEDVNMIKEMRDDLAKDIISEFLNNMKNIGYGEKEILSSIEKNLKGEE